METTCAGEQERNLDGKCHDIGQLTAGTPHHNAQRHLQLEASHCLLAGEHGRSGNADQLQGKAVSAFEWHGRRGVWWA